MEDIAASPDTDMVQSWLREYGPGHPGDLSVRFALASTQSPVSTVNVAPVVLEVGPIAFGPS